MSFGGSFTAGDPTKMSGSTFDINTNKLIASGAIAFSGTVRLGYASSSITTASSINVDLDASTCNIFNLELHGNIRLTASNPVAGASYLFFLRQDSGSTRTVTFMSHSFKFPGGTAPTLTTAAGSIDVVSGVSDGVFIYADSTKDFK